MKQKALLVLLALSLRVLAQAPPPPAQASSNDFSHVTISGSIGGFWLFDNKTGKIYAYSFVDGRQRVEYMGTLVEPGKPLATDGVASEGENLRSIATRTLEDLRLIDAAVDQWAIERNKKSGDQPTPKDVAAYLKHGSRLHNSLMSGNPTDVLGNPIQIPPVDSLPAISRRTFEHLSAVAPADFWKPFGIQ